MTRPLAYAARLPWGTWTRRGWPYALPLMAALVVAIFFKDLSVFVTAGIVVLASVFLVWRAGPAVEQGNFRQRWLVPFIPFALLVFVAAGLNALTLDLPHWLVVLVVAGCLLLLFARWLIPGPHWLVEVFVFLGAITIPVLALAGFNAMWDAIGFGRLRSIWFSLLVGAVLLTLALVAYLRPWWIREPCKHRVAIITAAVVMLVAAQPIGAAVMALNDCMDDPLPDRRSEVVSRLEVLMLRPSSRDSVPRRSMVAGWNVRTRIGDVTGRNVRWVGGPPPEKTRAGTERVVLLLPDGAPAELDRASALPEVPAKGGEVRRWLNLADRFARRDSQTFALLSSTRRPRLRAWARQFRDRSNENSGKRLGAVRSLQKLEGKERDLIGLTVRLAVFPPTIDDDLKLAFRHRPALFFDSDEPYPNPLNIERLLASGKMSLCKEVQAVDPECSKISSSADLHNSSDYIGFNPKDIADVQEDSTIYVNVSRAGNDNANSIYLDYWWYFPHNPVWAGRGALCGPGLVLGGVTCQDHQSDWEGVTVVLDAEKDPPAPTRVLYAQHEGTTSYLWSVAQRLWTRTDKKGRSELTRVKEWTGQTVDIDNRPMVFVALGTHASYPLSCPDDECRIAKVTLKEKRHDGKQSWSSNLAGRCRSSCVTAIPTRPGGNKRALWNAFAGYWGPRNCVTSWFCSTPAPPLSPAGQGRYRHPWCAKRLVVRLGGTDKSSKCSPRRDPAGRRRTLLALGDSYSSGQGAGDYDPTTKVRANTCYRSPYAWPQVLAEESGLFPIQSLACSGARIDDVDDGRSSREPERQISQISRIGVIGGQPDVITLTIGGNDVGFKNVLGACVAPTDCTRRYRKPSGDLLEQRIEKVSDELPALYRKIVDAAPRAKVVVTGYPRLFAADVSTSRSGNCAAGGLISAREAGYLNDVGRSLSLAIRRAALAANVEYVDVTEAFDGHELRCTGEPYVHSLHASRDSFHPTKRGHAQLADVVDRAIDPRR